MPTSEYGKNNRKGITWGSTAVEADPVTAKIQFHSIKSIKQLISIDTKEKYVAWDLCPRKDMFKHQMDMGNNPAYTPYN
jgi:hypothetical protein